MILKNYLRRRTIKALKRRRIIRERFLKLLKELKGKKDKERKNIRDHFGWERVYIPKTFLFLKNPYGVIKQIKHLENIFNRRKPVFVHLDNIIDIDYGAITALLAIIFKFKNSRLGFNGSFPKDPVIRQKLIESEFFVHLFKSFSNRTQYTIKKSNQIIGQAEKFVNSELGLTIMAEASKTIWGKQRSCKGNQRVLLELMQNTHNHASSQKEGLMHWWLSVNHDQKNKKVTFVFLDYGQGIFESLNSKPDSSNWHGYLFKAKKILTKGTNEEVMQKLLEGKLHQTITGQSFRGKGLPGIRQVLSRNQISNLHIISNDVFANVAKNDYKLLNKAFSGTFVYWELCYNNENKIWTT